MFDHGGDYLHYRIPAVIGGRPAYEIKELEEEYQDEQRFTAYQLPSMMCLHTVRFPMEIKPSVLNEAKRKYYSSAYSQAIIDHRSTMTYIYALRDEELVILLRTRVNKTQVSVQCSSFI